MTNKKFGLLLLTILLIATIFLVFLAGCGSKSEKSEIPSVEIKSEHIYEDGICTVCGYEASVWDGEAAFDFASGKGTKEDPYLITNAQELAFFAQTSGNVNYTGKYILLANNIDCNGKEWTPIGSRKSFSGHFDGAGHTISSFKITLSNSSVGFFASVSGSLQNLKIDNFFIGYDIDDNSLWGSSSAAYCGGLAGFLSGTISNCAVTNGRIYITNSMGFMYVGGAVGQMGANTLVNIMTDIDIYCETYGDAGNQFYGGIVGMMPDGPESRLSHCFSAGKLELKTADPGNHQCLAGLVGQVATKGEVCDSATSCSLIVSGTEGNKDNINVGIAVADFGKYGEIRSCYAPEKQILQKFSRDLTFDQVIDRAYVEQRSEEGLKAELNRLFDGNIWDLSGDIPLLKQFDWVSHSSLGSI